MSDAVRDPMVTVKHSKTSAEGRVPLSAVPHLEARGWTADTGQVKEATKTTRGETSGSHSKKTSD